MTPVKITKVNQIKNDAVIKELSNLEDDQIILIFTDGTFTKIPSYYEGQLKHNDTGEVINFNPINTYWRPLWVGIRLFNSDVRMIRQTQFKDVNYISHYIESDILKNN